VEATSKSSPASYMLRVISVTLMIERRDWLGPGCHPGGYEETGNW
jgi:hypothetical protein